MSEPVLPLAGLLVLDISTFIAAPAAAVALADYGADVIKIEAPGEGDPHRHNYKRAGTYPRSEHNFPLQLDGRLKRSLALDLKKPEARPVLEKLIRRASDVPELSCPTCGEKHLKQELSTFAARSGSSKTAPAPMCPNGGRCNPGMCGMS